MTESGRPATIAFDFEREDYAVLSQVLARRPVWRQALALALYAGLGALAYSAYGADPGGIPWWIVAFLIGGSLLTIFNTAFAGLIARLTYRRNPVAGQQMTLAFDTDGLVLTRPMVTSRIGWSAIRNVIGTPDHTVLAISRREGIVIPRRALAGAGDYDGLLAFIRASVEAAS